MTTLELVFARRDEILALAASFGAHEVRVFGSTVRGNDTGESDIDLLVRLDRGRTLLDLAGLANDLSELLEHDVDVITEGGIYEPLRACILAEARAL